MSIIAVVVAILLLVVLITGLKLNPFLAFLVSAIAAALMLGIPLEKIPVLVECWDRWRLFCAWVPCSVNW
jgi:H+/gluconate symporter-like permease